MEALEKSSAHEDERTQYLLHVARAERRQDVAFPLARITTCGTLTIEVLRAIHIGEGGHLEAVYGAPDAKLLAKKGASTAFTLLALLASQPGNFATKDWLSEKLGHLPKDEEEEDLEALAGLKRVDNVVSLLRHLLYPARSHESWDEKLMRRSLVAYQRASGESGPGYRLAGIPLLWLDVEEIREHVKRARRLEQFGEDGLAEWRTAYDLAMQGCFLPQEAYSDWAAWRRHDIETHLWDCVQVLWHRYVEQGEAGETEALCVLRAYWQSHVTNEDALRPLLELLGKHENFGQAEDCYNQLCATLATEGKQPDQRTRETMDFLRAMQIQRMPKAIDLTSSYPLSPPFQSERAHTISLHYLAPTSPSLTSATRNPESSNLSASSQVFYVHQQSQKLTELTPYERNIRAVLHIHRTSNAQSLLQDIDTDMQDLEYLEDQADGDLLLHIRTLLLANGLLATKIVKDIRHYTLAYAYANNAVRIAKSLGNEVLIATAKYTRGCTKLEWGLFGVIKQGRFHPDSKKIQDAIRDFQAILLVTRHEPNVLHPQLHGSTLLQLSRAQNILQSTSSESKEQHALLLADQAAEMVGCDPLDDPYTRLMVTGTLSGLHLGGYHLVKAGILNTAGLSDQAMTELHQLKRLTEQTYGQDETRNLAWSNITTAEALLGLKEYEEAAVKAKDALIACYHIHSIQNAMMITDIYSRITAGFHGTAVEVKELGDMLYTWYGNEQKYMTPL